MFGNNKLLCNNRNLSKSDEEEKFHSAMDTKLRAKLNMLVRSTARQPALCKSANERLHMRTTAKTQSLQHVNKSVVNHI